MLRVDLEVAKDVVRHGETLQRADVEHDEAALSDGVGNNPARQQQQLVVIQVGDELFVSVGLQGVSLFYLVGRITVAEPVCVVLLIMSR